MRAALARVLVAHPDVLLLDEPTNHLDIAAWRGSRTADVVPRGPPLRRHDRGFLEGVAPRARTQGRVRESSRRPGTRPAGGGVALARGKQTENQHAQIAPTERFVERFRYKATKARQAQSRVKRLDKMERGRARPRRDNRALGFKFGAAERTGRVVLDLQGARARGARPHTARGTATCGWSAASTCRSWGPNGAGKTTLIEALAGRRELEGGKLRTGHNVQLGYLSQHAEELGMRGTVLEAAQRATGLTPNKARALLGRFLFSGEEAEKPLDGGRAASDAACRSRPRSPRGANALILDEPTNHLDIDAREALEDALSGFDGNVLLCPTTARCWTPWARGRSPWRTAGCSAIRAAGRSTRACATSAATRSARARGARSARPRRRRRRRNRSNGRTKPAGPSKNAVRRAAQLEREVEKAEAALRAVEDELADPSAWASPTSSERATRAPRGGEEGRRTGVRPLVGRKKGIACSQPPSGRRVRARRANGLGRCRCLSCLSCCLPPRRLSSAPTPGSARGFADRVLVTSTSTRPRTRRTASCSSPKDSFRLRFRYSFRIDEFGNIEGRGNGVDISARVLAPGVARRREPRAVRLRGPDDHHRVRVRGSPGKPTTAR